MWCHAGFDTHAHHTGGYSSIADVYKANPKPIAYFQDGCHVSDFAAGRGKAFLGGAYVFNKSPTALLCMSGSRSGQWLGLMAKVMFQELGKNTCVGQAFKLWFGPYENKSEPGDKQNFIGWNYGYNIFGDPLITLVSRTPVITALHEDGRTAPRPFHVASLSNGRGMTIHNLTPSTTISIIPKMYTIAGRRISCLAIGGQNNGSPSVTSYSAPVSNGAYIISLQAGSFDDAQQIQLVKYYK
jgi:hypothetical protein